MDLFVLFVAEQWLLVTVLMALIYAYVWTEGKKGGATVSANQLTRMVNSGSAVVLDIRDAAEFKEGHIVDALHIPHAKINDRITELDAHKSKTIILADKMGQHAGMAGRALRAKGFEVNRLQGGMSEWQNNNLPVVK